jgi:hypothetical protein
MFRTLALTTIAVASIALAAPVTGMVMVMAAGITSMVDTSMAVGTTSTVRASSAPDTSTRGAIA